MNDLFADDCLQITLACPTDLPGFRLAARQLLANGTRPEQVAWHSSGLLAQKAGKAHKLQTPQFPPLQDLAQGPLTAPVVHVAPEFLELCSAVILHSDNARFELMYRLLWRMAREPGLRHDPLDADMIKAQHMAKAVRRDMHKMKAFVRFRTVADETFKARPLDGPLHVAWFEPEHHIAEAIAPFFARRFTQMRWAILTPERCMAWDGANLRFSPGAQKSDAPPPDAGEALWLTYYQSIFNPARLKMKAMQKEMPRRYWHNLPEAQFITTLAGGANQRQQIMVGQAPSIARRRIPAFQRKAEDQQLLRI